MKSLSPCYPKAIDDARSAFTALGRAAQQGLLGDVVDELISGSIFEDEGAQS
jgi:hypothetical protein